MTFVYNKLCNWHYLQFSLLAWYTQIRIKLW